MSRENDPQYLRDLPRPIRIAIHQPVLLPWQGFWMKAAKADVLVLMKGLEWNRNRWIRTGIDGSTISLERAVVGERIDTTWVSAASVKKLFTTMDQRVWSKKSKWPELKQFFEKTRQSADQLATIHLERFNLNLLYDTEAALRSKGHDCARLIEETYRPTGTTKTEKVMGFVQSIAQKFGHDRYEHIIGLGAADYLDAGEIKEKFPNCLAVKMQSVRRTLGSQMFVQTLAQDPQAPTHFHHHEQWSFLYESVERVA